MALEPEDLLSMLSLDAEVVDPTYTSKRCLRLSLYADIPGFVQPKLIDSVDIEPEDLRKLLDE